MHQEAKSSKHQNALFFIPKHQSKQAAAVQMSGERTNVSKSAVPGHSAWPAK